MKSTNAKWYVWLIIAVIMLFSPVAFLAAFISPNEYAPQGIEGAVDCDGPVSVMIFAVPSYLIYGSGFIGFTAAFFKNKKILYLAITMICFVVVLSITPNTIAAIKEHRKNVSEHLLTCGEGW